MFMVVNIYCVKCVTTNVEKTTGQWTTIFGRHINYDFGMGTFLAMYRLLVKMCHQVKNMQSARSLFRVRIH